MSIIEADSYGRYFTGKPPKKRKKRIKTDYGLGSIYDDRGNRISVTTARKLFRQGETIEIPNASAGSFKTVLEMLGFNRKKIEVEDWSSSAGDWTFIIHMNKKYWIYVNQENRYPYHGFRYAMGEY